eukprot:GEMP01049057.1.p1 GENE.GEMP01049057.1~~GEMP01049057.1.p1  ORF type:complete len:293 (+),score=46.13 GEMP01049057.1:367-1245(+)
MCAELAEGTGLFFVEDNVSDQSGMMTPCKHCRRLVEGRSAWDVFGAQKGTIALYYRNKQLYRVFPEGFAVPNCDNYFDQRTLFMDSVKKLATLTDEGYVENPLDTYDAIHHKCWCSRDSMFGTDLQVDHIDECKDKCNDTPGCTAFVAVKHSWEEDFHCSFKSTDPLHIRREMTTQGSATLYIRLFEKIPDEFTLESKYNTGGFGFFPTGLAQVSNIIEVFLFIAFGSFITVLLCAVYTCRQNHRRSSQMRHLTLACDYFDSSTEKLVDVEMENDVHAEERDRMNVSVYPVE